MRAGRASEAAPRLPALLLDTHVLIWWANGSPRLSSKARRALASSDQAVYVSAASAWEIRTKARVGKLTWDVQAGSLGAYALSQAFTHLPISVADAERAGAMDREHRDPFDRILVAQALAGDLTLVSDDAKLDEMKVRRLW